LWRSHFGVWAIVCYCIGLARAHETDTGRAVLAVFLPLIVCCGGGLLIAFHVFRGGRLERIASLVLSKCSFLFGRLAPGELDHELIWLSASVLSLGFAAVLVDARVAMAALRVSRSYQPAVRHVRNDAMRHPILHGHFLAALQWNPFVFAVLCGSLRSTYTRLQTRWRVRRDCGSIFRRSARKTFLRVSVISALALNWIYLLLHWRNF
jgi:hypothetical protein